MFGSVIRFLLIIIEIVSSLLLLGAILIQRTRSQGMGMAFGAGMGESLFGGQVGNVLTRATVILGVVFLANTSLLAIFYSRMTTEETSVVDSVPAPAAPLAIPGGGMGAPAAPPMAAPLATPAAAPVAMPPVEATTPIDVPVTPEPAAAVPAPDAPAVTPEAANPVVPAPAEPAPAPAAP